MKKTIFLSLCVLLLLAFNSRKASAQGSIFARVKISDICLGVDSGWIYTSPFMPGMGVDVFWGDGSSSSYTLVSSGGTYGYATYSHTYTSHGTYTVKCVLTYGGVNIDSSISADTAASCSNISCSVYNDVNSNCVYDLGDQPFWGGYITLEVDSAGIPVDTMTVPCGYTIPAFGPPGTIYAFKVIACPAGFTASCPSSGIVYDTIGVTTTTPMIGFHCTSGGFDLSVAADLIIGLTKATTSIWIYEVSSCTSAPATLTVTHSPKYTVSSVFTSGGTYTVSGNTITVSLGSMSAVHRENVLIQWVPVGTLAMGDTALVSYQIDPIPGDLNSTNNSLLLIDTIRYSWDPNDKSVTPQGYIPAGTKLQYSIAFENTGNDTAFNIHILDTLSDNLDFNTLKVLSASAPMNVIPLKYGSHSVLKFDFPHINLLDSSHHGLCDGMVTFSLNTKTGLASGTRIDNRAGIYFDVNEVVMTSTATNIIGLPSEVMHLTNSSKVDIYPNPVNELLTVNTTGNFNALTVSNTLGQVVVTGSFTNKHTVVNVRGLPAGMYYITLKGEDGVKVQKFEKL